MMRSQKVILGTSIGGLMGLLILGCGCASESSDPVAYINGNDSYFHESTCPSKLTNANAYPLTGLREKGYAPCPVCHDVPTTTETNPKAEIDSAIEETDSDLPDFEVYVTERSSLYHKKECRLLDTHEFGGTADESAQNGYLPCTTCKPRGYVEWVAQTAKQSQSSKKINTVKTSGASVYITDTGDKYHTSRCRHLDQSSYAIDKNRALSQGYVACKVCKPR